MRLLTIKHLQRQQGAALIISMLILIIMLLIGISAIRTTAMEEKMAGNLRDHGLAFQAAETALRDAEEFIEDQPNLSLFDGSGGLYGLNDDEPSVWFDASQWTASSSKPFSGTLPKIAAQPRFMAKMVLENKGDTPALNEGSYGDRPPGSGSVVFRITSRGTGGSNNSQVVLRSHYGKNL